MEIMNDFKNTEIGVIPQNWILNNLIETSVLKARIGWQGLTTKEYLTSGEYYLVTGTDFFNGKILWDDCHFVEKFRYLQDSNIQLKQFDILITKDGTIGKVAFINKLPLPATLNSGVFVLRPKNNSYLPEFLYYIFNSLYFGEFLRKLVAGSTINHLYQKDFISFKFPLPSHPEQTAIAEVLSDTDKLIQTLEKLIAKKRNIKQGAMKKLLQPKEGWEMKKLGEIGELITKGTTPTSLGREFQKNGINFIKIESLTPNGDIIPEKVAYIDEYTHQLLKRSQLKTGDILFSIAGALGRVAIVKNEILPANTNQALSIIRLKINSPIDLNYLTIYLTSEKIQTHILNVSVQGAQANLSLLNISQLLIDLPKSKEEQTRIATILSDMDAELNALESNLTKYKMLKLGMMQNLLTGKIRLIES